MPRATIKIRYKIRITHKVRVTTRVRYNVLAMTTARFIVSQARARGLILDDEHEQMVATARAMLPVGTDDDEIRDAIDAVCEEVEQDE